MHINSRHWIPQRLLLEITTPQGILKAPVTLFCGLGVWGLLFVCFVAIVCLFVSNKLWRHMQSAKDRMRKCSAEQYFSLSMGKIKSKHSNTNTALYEMSHVMAESGTWV